MSERDTYTIDAAGKSLGRVAAEAAKALMGKTRPDYVPHKLAGVKVAVKNTAKLRITEKKRASKAYLSYSGYPGGVKRETLAMLTSRKGTSEALRRAVVRMLPNNTMRVARMKNLTISE